MAFCYFVLISFRGYGGILSPVDVTAHVGVKIDLQNGIMSQQDARRVVCIAPSPVGYPAWHHHIRHLGEAMPGRIDENIPGIVNGARIHEFNRLVTHFERHLLEVGDETIELMYP